MNSKCNNIKNTDDNFEVTALINYFDDDSNNRSDRRRCRCSCRCCRCCCHKCCYCRCCCNGRLGIDFFF